MQVSERRDRTGEVVLHVSVQSFLSMIDPLPPLRLVLAVLTPLRDRRRLRRQAGDSAGTARCLSWHRVEAKIGR